MERNSQDRLAVVLIAVSCLVLYFNSLGNGFVFDDLHSIPENLYIKDPRYIPLFFKGHYASIPELPKGMFRPILMLTFSFNYLFSGLEPLGYHLINILFHFLNGILLYSLLRFLSPNINKGNNYNAIDTSQKEEYIPFGLSLGLSLLFTAHPVNTEAVSYIVSRSDLLVTIFITAAFISYARGRAYLVFFLYVLALLTKETGLVFPFLCFAYDFLRGFNGRPCAVSGRVSGIRRFEKKPFFYFCLIGIGLSYWLYRGLMFNSGPGSAASLLAPVRSFWSNILTQSAVTMLYLKLFFWPHPLSLHHSLPELNTLYTPLAFFSVLGMLTILFLVLIFQKRQPLISLGAAWYLVCLIPKFYSALNFPAMEHHLYLPSIGLYLALAGLVRGFYLKFRRQFIYLCLGIMGIFTVLVWARNYEWRSSLSLYKGAVKENPLSAVIHNNLGIEYLKMHLMEAAEKEFIKALSFSDAADVQLNCRINLAAIYADQKNFKKAIEKLEEAVKIKRDYSTIYQVYGGIYFQMNELEKAEEMLKEGLRFHPRAAGIIENLGLLYLKRDKLKEAKLCFLDAVKFNPDSYFAYFFLGQVFEEEIDPEAAIGAYKKSLQLNPAFASSWYSLGTIYAKRSDTRALKFIKEAVRLKPDFAEAHNNLAVLYASMPQPQLELAREHARKAMAFGYKVDKKFLEMIDLSPQQ